MAQGYMSVEIGTAQFLFCTNIVFTLQCGKDRAERQIYSATEAETAFFSQFSSAQTAGSEVPI